ncbi:MAG TPA: type II toxin-antitoxin system VapC family toxin [Planctomycetota bacterium]|nr:type II toxin-antitoxin system VapC family toxin [Planctomycetota bacterium]
MIVVDASAMLEVLLRTPAASRVEKRLFSSGESLHAPHLLDVEVAQVLRRNVLAGTMAADRGREALEVLADLHLTRHSHTPFLGRIWQLRHNVTAYDAAYLALAEALPATLVTRDARLSSVRGLAASVEVV